MSRRFDVPLLRRFASGASGAALLVLLTSCNGGPSSTISPSPVGVLTIDDIAVAVTAEGGGGLRRGGVAPPSNGGPTVDASGNSAIVNGGTLTVDLAASAPFTTAYVAVNVPSEGVGSTISGAIEGYFDVPLSAASTNERLLLSFPQAIPVGEFELRFAVVGTDGLVGPYVSLTVSVIQVGTGDIQVTLSWDADSDVDLHVVAPDGEEIYYGNQRGANGGTLDLDSNAACNIDGTRNENITWPVGTAPAGEYIVRVDYWSSCDVAETNYTVRINNGGNVQVITGTFTGEGNQGGLGGGLTVATFTRSSGTSTSSLIAHPPASQAIKAASGPGVKR